MSHVTIDGPAGPLEARYDQPDAAAPGGPAALLAHPHPQMGGTMHDAVLDTAADVLLGQGIACLRFNFRGAGASAGSFDNGDGERDDVRAALGWLREHTEGPISFVGYSFGSWVGSRVIAEDAVSLERLMLIAPPVGMLDYPDVTGTVNHIDAFAGTADDYVDLTALTAWAERNGTTVHPIEGANHFFAGRWQELAAGIQSTFG